LSTDLLAAGVRATAPDAAVVSVLVGDPGRAVDAAARLLAAGVRVGCFRPPSVPDGVSRLRLTARADLTGDEAARAVAAVAEVLRS
jgi:8-amino-7-oxononanoate synthase